VVARQAIGAILNLEASFQSPEETADVQTIALDGSIPLPDDLESEAWSPAFDRRNVPSEAVGHDVRNGSGRSAAWMRVSSPLADDQLLHRCWLAYMSDDMPADTVHRAHPEFTDQHGVTFTASLDHTIWFHRPLRADHWHLYDFACHGYTGARGLSIGHVFAQDGSHVATVAQEVLKRDLRQRQE
jgi:acyl-CoA thioesterase-2